MIIYYFISFSVDTANTAIVARTGSNLRTSQPERKVHLFNLETPASTGTDMEIQVNYYVIILSCIGFLLTCLVLCLIHVLLHHVVQTRRVSITSK